jgi:general secretion pathway protein G
MSGVPHSAAVAAMPSGGSSRSERRLRRSLGRDAGLTLLELVAACAILLVLASTAIPLTRVTVMHDREKMLRYDLREMREAIDRYKDASDKGLIQTQAGTEGYPPDLQTLIDGVELTGAGATAGSGLPVSGTSGTNQTTNSASGTQTAGTTQAPPRVRFLIFREIPVDPITRKVDWGLRSVQDDPDAKDWGGQDVFDVYSNSQDTALDGTKYSDW